MSERPAATAFGASVAAGALYFAIVFALGFVLGTIRTVLVQDAPGAGRLPGVLVELPIVVSVLLFRRTPAEHWVLYKDASYALGLAAQIGFALMPLVQLRKNQRN